MGEIKKLQICGSRQWHTRSHPPYKSLKVQVVLSTEHFRSVPSKTSKFLTGLSKVTLAIHSLTSVSDLTRKWPWNHKIVSQKDVTNLQICFWLVPHSLQGISHTCRCNLCSRWQPLPKKREELKPWTLSRNFKLCAVELCQKAIKLLVLVMFWDFWPHSGQLT